MGLYLFRVSECPIAFPCRISHVRAGLFTELHTSKVTGAASGGRFLGNVLLVGKFPYFDAKIA
jgi:hypothetical protein